jgi:Mg2+-importing ATPase
MPSASDPFWSVEPAELLRRLRTSDQGLTASEATARRSAGEGGQIRKRRKTSALAQFLAQFKSPIILILLVSAVLSLFVHDPTDAVIILVILLISSLLGFWQEYSAAQAVEKLLAMVRTTSTVLRDGKTTEVSVQDVMPGDMVLLSAGATIPGDCRLCEACGLFVDEAALTGETYPVDKEPATQPVDTPLAQRTSTVFFGTHVVSGTARVVVVHTGEQTEFGQISERLQLRPPESSFERGIRQFGYFLAELTLLLVVGIFAVNVFFHKDPQPGRVLDAFLFSLALAVGLTPQLLPAIISVNLARGARRMAEKRVIVRRLASIENFGSMDVLCSDKTGTLTEGVARLNSAVDPAGQASEKVLWHAYVNATLQTGFANPIDEAIRQHKSFDLADCHKLDEAPYDFFRKRLSVLVQHEGRRMMITKGALQNVLAVCTTFEAADGKRTDLEVARDQIERQYQELSSQGFRTLGVAFRELGPNDAFDKNQEAGMVFLGFVTLCDPPKAGMIDTVRRLKELGVGLRMITGDNRLVAAHVGEQVGLSNANLLTGMQIQKMTDEALRRQVQDVQVFAEIEPNQKERIIHSFQKAGYVVGYLGDGINDASALHAADVGISVESAVDVAKEAADIVLLDRDLNVLVEGVREGRVTFANTLKYVFMATSANFGNMFSMACISVALPFLPLLPKQILLMNLLTDLPEMTIATDSVDAELVERPRRWDLRFIRNFMLVFGGLSSLFDLLTFLLLREVLGANEQQFRTGWFLESVISATLIVLVVRSRRPFFQSRPGKLLLAATLLVIGLTILLPWSPLAGLFKFEPLPLSYLAAVGGVVALYVLSAELAKAAFYRWLQPPV